VPLRIVFMNRPMSWLLPSDTEGDIPGAAALPQLRQAATGETSITGAEKPGVLEDFETVIRVPWSEYVSSFIAPGITSQNLPPLGLVQHDREDGMLRKTKVDQ
jgi:hypothetical protein